MLAAAEALLRERGLPGAGIQQVVAEGGAPIGSVYHFFPGGKAQLVAEAVGRHGARARALLEGAFADERPLPERIRTLFRGAARGFDEAGGRRSCAVGNVTLGLGAADEELRGTCAGAFESWISALEPLLPWSDAPRRRTFAEMVVLALEGAFVLARARASGQPFVTAGEWLAACAEAEGRTDHSRSSRRKR
jgi:AcrR family transcriptional regulator